MKKFVFSFLFLISFASSAQESPQTEPAPTPAPVVEQQQKKVILQGYLGLFGIYKTLPAGLAASYILSPHFIVSAEHSIGSNSFIFDGGRNTTNYSLGLKYFPKPPQFSTGRLYYRALINYSEIESEEFTFWSSEDWNYRADAFSATLSLGFQQMYASGLTFTVDIIGVNIPLSEKYKNERAINATSYGLMRDNQKNLSTELSLTLLWVYIGLAF